MSKQRLLIDADGTLFQYDGWKGSDVWGAPLPNARAAMMLLSRNYELVCFCSRLTQYPECLESLQKHLARHGFPHMKVTNKKDSAHLCIDDRAIQFTGEWNDDLLTKIKSFQPWWKATGSAQSGSPQSYPASSQSVSTENLKPPAGSQP
jgi:hypothetical protein